MKTEILSKTQIKVTIDVRLVGPQEYLITKFEDGSVHMVATDNQLVNKSYDDVNDAFNDLVHIEENETEKIINDCLSLFQCTDG